MSLHKLSNSILSEIVPRYMNVGIYVEDLKSGDILNIDGDCLFPSASAIKVPIAVHMMQLVSEQKISLENTIHMDLSHEEYQQPMGSGVLTNLTSNVDLNLYDILLLSLAESDNIATNELLKLTSMSAVNKTLESLGIKKTRVTSLIHDFARLALPESNPATARELSTLFKMMYKNQIPQSATLIKILQAQKYVSRIPYLLPEFDFDILVANKTGSVGTNIHDTGLIQRPEFAYTITVLTSNCKTWREASLTIARIADQVYQHMCHQYQVQPTQT